MPAAVITRWTIGARASACPRNMSSCSCESTWPSDNTAAEQAPSAVSTARIFTAQACSNNAARFVEIQPAGAGPHSSPIAITEIAQEIGFDRGAGKEFPVDARIIETRHRPAIQTQSACGHNEVACLQTAIAERSFLKFGGCSLLP